MLGAKRGDPRRPLRTPTPPSIDVGVLMTGLPLPDDDAASPTPDSGHRWDEPDWASATIRLGQQDDHHELDNVWPTSGAFNEGQNESKLSEDLPSKPRKRAR